MPAQRLEVSKNKGFLVTEKGKSFFYMADTAWELFHRCSKAEVIMYLKKRAEKGFNVIQAEALAEEEGLNIPNTEGEKPVFDNDLTRPNPKYFEPEGRKFSVLRMFYFNSSQTRLET